ncbi:hypothetical protein J3E69DRAFT_313169 [Trichoderma sp. SZMC 28015]
MRPTNTTSSSFMIQVQKKRKEKNNGKRKARKETNARTVNMRAVHTRFTLTHTAVQSRQTRRPAPCWHPVSAAAHSLARLRHAPFQPPRLNTKWSGNALGLADCRASALACCLSTGSGSRSGTVLVPAACDWPKYCTVRRRSIVQPRPPPREREREKKKEPCQFYLFTLHCSALVVSLRRQLAGHSFHLTNRIIISRPQIALGGSLPLSPATLQYTTVHYSPSTLT